MPDRAGVASRADSVNALRERLACLDQLMLEPNQTPPPHPALTVRSLATRFCFFAALAAAALSCPAAQAQDHVPPTLRVGDFNPQGIRFSATESWGTFGFEVTNLTDQERQARVVAFYPERPDVRFGRDIWVPAHATTKSWMLVGPPGKETPGASCQVQVLLFDRTDGRDRRVLPTNDERPFTKGVLYRKREPFTAIVQDEDVPPEMNFGQLPQPDSNDQEANDLTLVIRSVNRWSNFVQKVYPEALPLSAEAYNGVDHLAIASPRIGRDPAGLRTLRQWVERGGRVWVMLDRMDPDVVAPLLGEALDFQVVDRVGLTTTKIQSQTGVASEPAPRVMIHDRPVEFARVLLPPEERPTYTINGWPAWFVRRVGRGKVIFTTLGPRAWYHSRNEQDPRSFYEDLPRLPVAEPALEAAALELQRQPEEDLFKVNAFQPMLVDEIGYSVVGRRSVALVAGGFLLGTILLGLFLRRLGRRELLGWLGPAAALAAAAVFVALGESARRSAPATMAFAQVVDADAGTPEAAARGLLAMYRPDDGQIDAGSRQPGLYELDMAGIQGQTRTLMLTDIDSWHWDNLSLPAGVRFAQYWTTIETGEPISAVGQFGPDGLEGRLTAGVFRDLEDAILSTPSGRNLSVRLQADGAFSARTQDVLPPGEYLAGAVLSDRQQRRQELYREFLKQPTSRRGETRPMLLAWGKAIEMRFSAAPDSRTSGSALLVVPVRLVRPAPGRNITVPGSLIPYERIVDNRATRLIPEGSTKADLQLRFQLPPSVLPLKIERARVVLKIDAPSRRVSIRGHSDGGLIDVGHADSPLDPIRFDIEDEKCLQPDAHGGLHLDVSIGGSADDPGRSAREPSIDKKWQIEYLELEISGRTE
jgi:hypothetical protein